jgi:hypothetical protein
MFPNKKERTLPNKAHHGCQHLALNHLMCGQRMLLAHFVPSVC